MNLFFYVTKYELYTIEEIGDTGQNVWNVKWILPVWKVVHVCRTGCAGEAVTCFFIDSKRKKTKFVGGDANDYRRLIGRFLRTLLSKEQ